MIVVIADDLSGAAELGGAARLHGLTAEVQTRFTAETRADVVCVATGTRALPAEEAAARAGLVAREVAEARPEWVYLKFDSVLRGNILVELRAAMAAVGARDAILVTANPSRGRVIRGGRYLVDGIPLHETAFALDPEHPCTTDSVVELLGGDPAGVSTPDVAEPADLRRVAAGVTRGCVTAGSAEFFVALLERWKPVATAPSASAEEPGARAEPRADTRPVTLLACGSLASWEIRRREAAARGIEVFDLGDDLTEVHRALQADRTALIGIGEPGATPRLPPACLVDLLAQRIADVMSMSQLDRLLLEGGATAAAVLRRLGYERLTVLRSSEPGVGSLRPIGARGPTLLIKPGSYPWPAGAW